MQQRQENFANRQTSHFRAKSPYIWVTSVPSVILFSFFLTRLSALYNYKHSSRNIITVTFNGYIIIEQKMNVHINKPNYYSALIQNIVMWYAWLVSNRLLSILIDLLLTFFTTVYFQVQGARSHWSNVCWPAWSDTGRCDDFFLLFFSFFICDVLIMQTKHSFA